MQSLTLAKTSFIHQAIGFPLDFQSHIFLPPLIVNSDVFLICWYCFSSILGSLTLTVTQCQIIFQTESPSANLNSTNADGGHVSTKSTCSFVKSGWIANLPGSEKFYQQLGKFP